jgi:hypothetical protein
LRNTIERQIEVRQKEQTIEGYFRYVSVVVSEFQNSSRKGKLWYGGQVGASAVYYKTNALTTWMAFGKVTELLVVSRLYTVTKPIADLRLVDTVTFITFDWSTQ